MKTFACSAWIENYNGLGQYTLICNIMDAMCREIAERDYLLILKKLIHEDAIIIAVNVTDEYVQKDYENLHLEINN